MEAYLILPAGLTFPRSLLVSRGYRGFRSKAYLRRNHDATSFLHHRETIVLPKASAGVERKCPREELSLGCP